MHALRVSANGRGTAVLRALRPLLAQHPVRSVQLEWAPEPSGAGGADHGGLPALVALLGQLMGLGFSDVQHSGNLCAARWEAARSDVLYLPRDSGAANRVDAAQLQLEPCRLVGDDLKTLWEPEDKAGEGRMEVFLLRRPSP